MQALRCLCRQKTTKTQENHRQKKKRKNTLFSLSFRFICFSFSVFDIFILCMSRASQEKKNAHRSCRNIKTRERFEPMRPCVHINILHTCVVECVAFVFCFYIFYYNITTGDYRFVVHSFDCLTVAFVILLYNFSLCFSFLPSSLRFGLMCSFISFALTLSMLFFCCSIAFKNDARLKIC